MATKVRASSRKLRAGTLLAAISTRGTASRSAHGAVGRARSARGGWRRSRGSLAAALALLCLWLVLPGTVGAATVQQPETPAVLSGEGTDYSDLLVRGIDQSTGSSPAAPVLEYIGSNEAEGLRAFVEGRTQYYVGALPLDEALPGATQALKAGNGFISAPFQATAAVPFMSGPFGSGYRWCAPGTVIDLQAGDIYCPETSVRLNKVRSGAPGDSLRLYPQNIVSMFTQSTPSELWEEPSFVSQADPSGCPKNAAGECLQRIEGPGVPGPVSGVRTDNAAINKYLQQYLRQQDPAAFESRMLPETPAAERPGYQITTRWPRSAQASRQPDEALVSSIRNWTNFQSSEIPKGGSIAFVHPLKARLAIDLEAQDATATPPKTVTDLWIPDFVSDGEVRSATPDAITKAIAAGGETPFYAASHPVASAWPFAWVNRIYFPAKGLSVDQTNAAATMLRWQMTVGQAVAPTLADGMLTLDMTKEGIKAANDLVASNCAAAKGKVVKEVGAGPFTPKDQGAVFDALGPQSWCQATAATPAPATNNPTLPLGITADDMRNAGYSNGSLGSFNNAYESGTDSGYTPIGETYDTATDSVAATVAAAVAAADGAGAKKADLKVEEISADTPLELPGKQTRGMDRIATVALGAALFFLVRAIWRSGALQRMAGAAT